MNNNHSLTQAIEFMLKHPFLEMTQDMKVGDLTKLVRYNNNKSILEYWNVHSESWEQWSPSHYDIKTTFSVRQMNNLPDLFWNDRWELIDGVPSIVSKEGEVWKGTKSDEQYNNCLKAKRRYEFLIEEYEKRWKY